MDWSNLFDDSGEEDIYSSQLMEEQPREPRLERLIHKIYHDDLVQSIGHHHLIELSEQHEANSYSLDALYYLSINYILGVGCLGIPYAFARAGFLLCLALLATITLFSYITVMWVAETGERYETEQRQQRQMNGSPIKTETALLLPQIDESVHQDRYEVIDLVSHYLGPVHRFLYQTSLIFLMYVGLLAYTQVFCGSLSALLWHNAPPGFSQLVFGVLVVPLSCMELDEQVSIQSLMASMRFLAIFIMVAGSLAGLLLDADNAPERQHPPYMATPETDTLSYTACFSGFGVAFSTSLFSQLFQHSIPGLLRPLKTDQPQSVRCVPRVMCFSLLTTGSLYLLLGMSAASFFGANTKSSVNLNFANFYFGLNAETIPAWFRRCLQVLSGIVVIFPALDTLSVFPLIANTLGNNLYADAGPNRIKWVAKHIVVRGQSPHHRRKYSDLALHDRKLLLQQASQVCTVFWRLVAALPPLVGSIWATDLSFSLLLSGIAGLYVAFFAPSLLRLTANKAPRNLFSSWYSSSIWAYPVLAFASFAFCIVVSQIDDAWRSMHPVGGSKK
jgi:amino acid permease